MDIFTTELLRMTPIIEKTLDLGIHAVSSREYHAFHLFRTVSSTLTLSVDPLWGLYFHGVSRCVLELHVSSVDFESVPKHFCALYVDDFK